jgi:hypothetical protein
VSERGAADLAQFLSIVPMRRGGNWRRGSLLTAVLGSKWLERAVFETLLSSLYPNSDPLHRW